MSDTSSTLDIAKNLTVLFKVSVDKAVSTNDIGAFEFDASTLPESASGKLFPDAIYTLSKLKELSNSFITSILVLYLSAPYKRFGFITSVSILLLKAPGPL